MTGERNVILFAGQSGISAKDCLHRLNDRLNQKAKVISVEKTMSEVSNRSFRREIILENIPYQYELWEKAFEKALAQVNDLSSSEKLFLTSHCVYYHQDMREFFSPVNLEMMRKLQGKVKMLIVFIDDIYDVYRRLMRNGEMFSYVKKLEPVEALYASSLNLISILEWRQVEITVCRLIQQMLDIPMYIIATKHPVSMVARLIDKPIEELRIFYLCHPISEVRRSAIERLPNFTGHLNRFSKEIIDIDDVVLFLPSTIDEFIVKKQGDKLVPECLPRWPLPFEEGDWISPPMPKDLSEINPLNPLGYNISTTEESRTFVSYLMKLLVDCISVKMTSRDLSLVEQSKNGVIVYRPRFPNKLSGGIRRELEHNHNLYNKQTSRRSIIVSVEEDLGKSRIRYFFTSIETFVKDLGSSDKANLKNECYKWMMDSKMIKLFSDDVSLKKEWINIRDKIEEIIPKSYEFEVDFLFYETSLSPGEMGKQEIARRQGYEYLLNMLLKDTLKDYIISAQDYKSFSSYEGITIDVVKEKLGNKK
jgi:hypothetical protein